MKKALIVSIVVGLVAAWTALPSAQARPRARKVTMYLHGNQPLGELELQDTYLNGIWHVMNTTPPADPVAKSQFVTNYVAGPNAQCSGNGLLPTWRGSMAGTVVDNVKVTLHTVAGPDARMVVGLFRDADGGCDEDMTPPVASKTITVTPGPAVTRVVFRDVRVEVLSNLVLQLNMVPETPGQVRVLYDSPEMNSSVSFKCIPRVGRRCT